jgi:hypothetical protein
MSLKPSLNSDYKMSKETPYQKLMRINKLSKLITKATEEIKNNVNPLESVVYEEVLEYFKKEEEINEEENNQTSE